MLEIRETITIMGKSVIDGVEVCGYQAQISSTNPNDMNLTDWQNNKELYKANRAVCRKDQADFEDYAYSVQDKMLAEVPVDEPAEA